MFAVDEKVAKHLQLLDSLEDSVHRQFCLVYGCPGCYFESSRVDRDKQEMQQLLDFTTYLLQRYFKSSATRDCQQGHAKC